MKRLSFEQERKGVPETARSPANFWRRMKETAMVGVALLGLGGCASAIAGAHPTVPQVRSLSAEARRVTEVPPSLEYGLVSAKDAVSPTASTVEIAGRTLNIVRLDTRLAELDRQTAQYRGQEMTTSGGRGLYINSVTIPNEVGFIVSGQGETATLTIGFSPSLEPNPSAEGAGTRMVSLSHFTSYVRNVSGQEMTRVNFVLERGTFNNNGVTTNYVNAYIFPLNSQGDAITRRGNGEFIVYGATYYNNSAGGSISLLVEPNGQDSLYARR
ncbi:MAG: hypothetical protein V1861_02265 [Candidatus Micrarchaeota archaeon]